MGKVEKEVTENLKKKQPEISINHHIKIPYPQRFRKNTLDKQFSKFLECNVILQKKLPPKLKDLGCFNIPCTIGNEVFKRALCDLGEIVNLISLSIYRKQKLGEAKSTIVKLQIVDHSVKHLHGVIEDVLVKVDKFIFPAYFIILDLEEDANIPIILGRPFLATGRALIDVQKGELQLRV
ncbi:uncharacterized protein LOC133805711 [Humulus lupulus]|uniref:uncharacterized protein LOC133805711 n=1 Tax=Humulus lupulus TaxID=3486 RepID=UPI002B407DE7|nr:uncharacterized protein LOC133805711 [Humulus lupulus]